jgi:hypothetical protein
MTIENKKAKRARDLLASALAGENNAWEMFCDFMDRESIHVDDLGIGSVGASGGVGDGGGEGSVSGSFDPDAVALQDEPYIRNWLANAEVRYAYDHTLSWGRDAADPLDPLSRVGRQPLTLRRIVRALTVDATYDEVKLTLRLINAVLANWMDEQRTAYTRNIFSQIDFVSRKPSLSEEDQGRVILEKLCSFRLDEDPKYATAVILTIIHQIKRKILCLTADHHLVLMICSQAGGSGKSEFIKALLGPLQAMAANTRLEELLDDRNTAIWTMYAINLDDVDESAAKQKGQFRRRISQDVWMSRILGKGDIQSIANNATVVGSTHHRIYEIMPDTFSMRRFAELFAKEIPPSAEAIDAVDNADWFAVWRSVDAEGPRPIDKLGHAAVLRARQEDARVRGPVEQWAADITMADPGYARHVDATGWIKAGDLYEHCYQPYAALNLDAEGRLSKDKFGKLLRSLLRGQGVKSRLEVRDGRNTTEYRIREAPPMPTEAPPAPKASTITPLLPRPDATRH